MMLQRGICANHLDKYLPFIEEGGETLDLTSATIGFRPAT
jgi:hypothetical protein